MKVLIIEDHGIVVSGCRALFAEDQNVELIEANSLSAARKALNGIRPDVIVADINLPDGSGLEFTRTLLAEDPLAKVIVFSMSDAPILAAQAIDAGAQGYVSKNGNPMDLREAVFALERGERWLPDNLVQEVALLRASGSALQPALSEREARVLRGLVDGRSMAEIASELDISYKTVANDCAALRAKLSARTNPHMVRIALDMKIA